MRKKFGDDTEKQLISTIANFAALNNVNCHFSAGLANRIHQTGKKIDSLTIAEFLAISQRYSDDFNGISVWKKDEERSMNAPTLNHRSCHGGDLAWFGDLTDTLSLAIDRADGVARIAAITFASGNIPSSQAVLGAFDSIANELADMRVWLEWWNEHRDRLEQAGGHKKRIG